MEPLVLIVSGAPGQQIEGRSVRAFTVGGTLLWLLKFARREALADVTRFALLVGSFRTLLNACLNDL